MSYDDVSENYSKEAQHELLFVMLHRLICDQVLHILIKNYCLIFLNEDGN